LTTDFDSSVDSITWAPDGRSIYFTAEEKGTTPIFAVSVKDSKVRKVVDGGVSGSVSISSDGKILAFTRSTLQQPDDVHVCSPQKAEPPNLPRANTDVLKELDLQRPESVTVPGAEGVPMQMWLIKPPGFDTKKKWPLAFIVHGGPQGAWHDGWGYRWNAELWA